MYFTYIYIYIHTSISHIYIYIHICIYIYIYIDMFHTLAAFMALFCFVLWHYCRGLNVGDGAGILQSIRER